jgi:hypothetical protein
MALRVAKGMFRLWLVVSALWVSGVAVVTWYDLPSDPWAVFHPVPDDLVYPKGEAPDDLVHPEGEVTPSLEDVIIIERTRGLDEQSAGRLINRLSLLHGKRLLPADAGHA